MEKNAPTADGSYTVQIEVSKNFCNNLQLGFIC